MQSTFPQFCFISKRFSCQRNQENVTHSCFLFPLQLKLVNYVKALDQAKLGLSGIPDRQDLREARDDLERVLSVHPCLSIHLEMGQVGQDTKHS